MYNWALTMFIRITFSMKRTKIFNKHAQYSEWGKQQMVLEIYNNMWSASFL